MAHAGPSAVSALSPRWTTILSERALAETRAFDGTNFAKAGNPANSASVPDYAQGKISSRGLQPAAVEIRLWPEFSRRGGSVQPRLSKIKVTSSRARESTTLVSLTPNRVCSKSCLAKEGLLLVSTKDLKAHQNTFRKFDLLDQQALA